MTRNVCFYVYGYPPDYSGATIQALKLAGVLEQKGCRCVFVSYTYKQEFLNASGDNRFKLIRFLRPQKGLFLYHVRLLKSLFKAKGSFDTLYINGNEGQFWTPVYIALFCKIFSKKVFMELNMEYADPLSISGTTLDWLKRMRVASIDGYISLSSAIHGGMQANYPEAKSTLLYNGVDTNVFRPASCSENKTEIRKKLGLPLSGKVVVTCGGVSKRKGIDFLIDVWQSVVGCEDEPQLHILGPLERIEGFTSDFTTKVLAQAESSKMKGSVVFQGMVDNVHEYFMAADLFIFAGRQEGSPNVLREAMAAGLPIVSLELEGITTDMIESGVDGVIVNVPDQAALRNYLHTVIDDPNIKNDFVKNVIDLLTHDDLAAEMGRKAREKALSHFTLERQAKKLIDLMDKL